MLRAAKLLGLGAAVGVVTLAVVFSQQLNPSTTAAQHIVSRPQQQDFCLKDLFTAISLARDSSKSRYSSHESHETIPKTMYRALKAGALLAGANKPAKFWERASGLEGAITKLPACE